MEEEDDSKEVHESVTEKLPTQFPPPETEEGDHAFDEYGYPIYWADGKWMYTQRLSWFLKKGPIPAGKDVAMSCGNKSCFAPDHMVLTTALRYFYEQGNGSCKT